MMTTKRSVVRDAKVALRQFAKWNDAAHPRQPAGSEQGGEFAPGSKIDDGKPSWMDSYEDRRRKLNRIIREMGPLGISGQLKLRDVVSLRGGRRARLLDGSLGTDGTIYWRVKPNKGPLYISVSDITGLMPKDTKI